MYGIISLNCRNIGRSASCTSSEYRLRCVSFSNAKVDDLSKYIALLCTVLIAFYCNDFDDYCDLDRWSVTHSDVLLQLHVCWRLRRWSLRNEHRRLSRSPVSEQCYLSGRHWWIHLYLSTWIHRWSGADC